jgi:hypothetical protein
MPFDYHPSFLFGSTKGLIAVAKFIKETGIFTKTWTPYSPPKIPELPGLDISDDPP